MKDVIKKAFQSVFEDPSATVSFDQLRLLLNAIDKSFPDDAIKALFDAADKNKNGKIEFCEFIDFICDEEGVEEAGPSHSELVRQNTFDGARAGRLFNIERWQQALSGGAWAFSCDLQSSAIRKLVNLLPVKDPLSPEGLTLAEEFVLIWHNEETGELAEYSYFGADQPFHNALFGACVLGLRSRGCLEVREEDNRWYGKCYKLKVSATPPSDSKVLEMLHQELATQPDYTLKDWFEEKSGKWGEDDSTQLTLEDLVKKGVLEKGTEGGAYHNAKFMVKDKGPENAMLSRLRSVASGEVEADARSVALLALCRTADMRDQHTNHLMRRIFGGQGDVAEMTAKVDALVSKIVAFGGIGSEEIDRMIQILPGELQQMFATQEFKEDAKQQFRDLDTSQSGRIRPEQLAKVLDGSIGDLVKEKLGISGKGMETVISMFDSDQDGFMEEESFIGFLKWCHALTALA